MRLAALRTRPCLARVHQLVVPRHPLHTTRNVVARKLFRCVPVIGPGYQWDSLDSLGLLDQVRNVRHSRQTSRPGGTRAGARHVGAEWPDGPAA